MTTTSWPATGSPCTPVSVTVAVAVDLPSAVIELGVTDTCTFGGSWVNRAVPEGLAGSDSSVAVIVAVPTFSEAVIVAM